MKNILGLSIKNNNRIALKVLIAVLTIVIVGIFFLIKYRGINWSNLVGKEYLGIFVLICVFSLIAILLAWMGAFKKIKLEILFIILFSLVGTTYITVFTPYSAPDEWTHVTTIYYYANMTGGEERVSEDGYTIVRETDTVFDHSGNYSPDSGVYQRVNEAMHKEIDTDPTVYPSNKPISVLPTCYIPQIIGTGLSKVLGFNGIMTLYAMKIASFIASAVCFFFAIKITPIGKLIFFAMAFFPMTLELCTSASYDSSVIAFSALYLAYVLYLIYKKDKIGIIDFVPLLLYTVFVLTIKPTYFFVALLIFLIPKEKYGGRKKYWTYNSIIIAIQIVILLVITLARIGALLGEQEVGGVSDAYTMAYALQNPLKTLWLVVKTPYVLWQFYLDSMIGTNLGWLEIPLQNGYVYGFIIVLLLVAFGQSGTDKKMYVGKKSKIFISIICILVALSVLVSMLFANTTVDSGYITGVQGRYLLPILPLAMLVLRNKTVKVEETVMRFIPYALTVINAFAIVEVFSFIVSR